VRRPPWTRDRRVVAATLAAAAASAGLVIVPLVKLGQIMVDDGGSSIRRVLRSPGLGHAALHSLLLAVVVPLIAVPVGSAAALVLRRSDVPGRALLRLAIVAPLIIPQFVLGYSWTQAYGRAGFTDTELGVWWRGLDGPAGIVVVLAVDAVPLCYLLTTVGLATGAQPELERAAHLSGAGGWTALRTVTLPLLRPVLAAEVVLTFVATMESFAVPQVLGAPSGFATLTTRIYADLSLASDPDSFLDAVTLALGLVVVAAVVLVPADLVLAPRLRAIRTGQPAAAEQRARRSWRAGAAALLIAGYTLLVVGVPTVALLAAAVTRAIGVPPTPSNWTLANFRTALDGPTVDAIGHSLQLAALAAFALTAFGALVAALERRGAARALGPITILTFAIPGSALAVGLLIAYGRWFGAGLGLILVAYLAKFWALAHRTLSGALDRLPPAEWQAARTSGARAPVAVATIWLPSLAPALLGAWVLVFLSALHEVTMSSLLYSFGNQTLAVAVLNRQEIGDVGATAALSVVLTALVVAAAVPVGLLLHLTARHRAGAATRATAAVIVGPRPASAVPGAR
jgi:iron(III) transport system permease protein